MKLNGILYRIMTEDLNRDQVIKLASKYFDGYSISKPGARSGFWKGQEEASLLIEVITSAKNKVMQLANEIKKLNNQESVLVEAIANNAWLV
ncbi:hypothetical protein LCGC14_2797650 [marine sediment metagenome]|uniref:Uncharacterized protein n=1 Tax=marine sediment metagenome TaxID=412755 RepID=A0A0F8YNR9_9ZZZZ